MEGWLLKNRSFLVSPLPHLPTHAASIGLMLPNVSNPKLRTHRSRRPQPPHHHHQWPRCRTRCLRAHEADLSRRVKSLGSSGCYEGRSCPQYSIPDGAAILRQSTTNLPECSSAFQIPNLLIFEIEFKFLIVSGMFLVSIWKVLGIFHDLPMLFPLRFVYCPLCSMIFQCVSMFFLSFSLQFPIMFPSFANDFTICTSILERDSQGLFSVSPRPRSRRPVASRWPAAPVACPWAKPRGWRTRRRTWGLLAVDLEVSWGFHQWGYPKMVGLYWKNL